MSSVHFGEKDKKCFALQATKANGGFSGVVRFQLRNVALSSRDVLLPQRERNVSASRVLARIAINVFEVLRYGSANCRRLVTGVPHFIRLFL